MKKYMLAALVWTLAGIWFQLHAEAQAGSKGEFEESNQNPVQQSESAALATREAGAAEVAAAPCDPGYEHCSCVPMSHDASGDKVSGTD